MCETVLHSEFQAQLPLLIVFSTGVYELESLTLSNRLSVVSRNIAFNLILVMWIRVFGNVSFVIQHSGKIPQALTGYQKQLSDD